MRQVPAARPALPFEPRAPSDGIIGHAGWWQAQRTVLEALAAGWLAVVVGESGSGRTTLLRELERLLRAGGLKTRLGGPDLAAEPGGHDAVRLVDDADALDDEALRRLALGGGATVLAILPGSAGRVRDLPVRVATAHLPPLSQDEAEDFVRASLAGAGRSPDLFGADALAALVFLSGGLPGRLNGLGRAALLRARLDGAPRVATRHVREAAEVPGPGPAGERDGAGAGRMTPGTGVPEEVADARTRPARRRLAPALLTLAFLGAILIPVLASRSPAPPHPGPDRPVPPMGPVADATAPSPPPLVPEPDAVVVAPSGVAPLPATPTWADPSRPEPVVPRPEEVRIASGSVTFRGTTYNETLTRAGALRLAVTRVGRGEAVVVRFEAGGGLVGAGQLTGRLSPDGRLFASGTLMMGRNPFATELEGTISGDRLIGTARYERVAESGTRSTSRGTFRLARVD